MNVGDDPGLNDPEAMVRMLYTAVLGREVDQEALGARVAALKAGESFVDMFRSVATSEEAGNRLRASLPPSGPAAPAEPSPSPNEDRIPLLQEAVTFAYRAFLHRAPSVQDVEFWSGLILAGMSVERFLSEIARSEEARIKASQREIGAGLSDGEFLMAASEPLFGRGLMPTETVAWQRRLETENLTRAEMVRAVVGERINAASHTEAQPIIHNPNLCSILGTSRVLSRDEWNSRADELLSGQRSGPDVLPLAERRFQHTGQYQVSMIASLYRGRAYIEKFLENIVSQTLFDRSELIIVDADSPEREGDIIQAYCEIYPNIVYKRINYRLGIYDAWNVGVQMARGLYLTNTNLDDLRRRDSIALQAALLDAEPHVDVVYQDFYYSFDARLSFEQVEAFGFKSELPILTPNNLLLFNSPHNAPMWRRSLHNEIGMFDTRYKSAGDYEFWLRCAVAGKSFSKINSPHVVYFQNPEGISTRPDTRGIEEARDILRRFGAKLTRSALLQSRRDLYAGLSIEDERPEDSSGKAYFDVIQDALIRLGNRGMLKGAALLRDTGRAVDDLVKN